MTTYITKTWFDGEKVVTQEIPESEAYKQEPVAWMDASETALSWENYLDGMKPLYTTPPAAQRQPLTKERIGQIIEQCRITMLNYCSDDKQTEFARAIEAAHGIGEKK